MIDNKIILSLTVLACSVIAGCEADARKCIKSHTETSCSCVCSNNVGIPITNRVEKCDIFEGSEND